MGFGLLFLGYLFMYSFPYKGLDILPDIVGFLISFIGVNTLADYGCGWDNMKKYYYLIIPSSALTLFFQIMGLLEKPIAVAAIWYYAYTALLLVYNVLLLTSIYKIAIDTEVMSIKAKAQRNMVLGVIYYSVMLILELPINYVQSLKEYLSTHYALGLLLFIFGYVWQFLNLALIFSCYMWICREGDEDMPIKESKFFKKKKDEETED